MRLRERVGGVSKPSRPNRSSRPTFLRPVQARWEQAMRTRGEGERRSGRGRVGRTRSCAVLLCYSYTFSKPSQQQQAGCNNLTLFSSPSASPPHRHSRSRSSPPYIRKSKDGPIHQHRITSTLKPPTRTQGRPLLRQPPRPTSPIHPRPLSLPPEG